MNSRWNKAVYETGDVLSVEYDTACRLHAARNVLISHQDRVAGSCCSLLYPGFWVLIEVVNPDLGVWKSWGCIADSSPLLTSLFLCVCSCSYEYVRTIKSVSFVFLKSKLLLQVTVLRTVEVRVGFLWTCLGCFVSNCYPLPQTAFHNSCKASDPSSNSSNTNRCVTIN